MPPWLGRRKVLHRGTQRLGVEQITPLPAANYSERETSERRALAPITDLQLTQHTLRPVPLHVHTRKHTCNTHTQTQQRVLKSKRSNVHTHTNRCSLTQPLVTFILTAAQRRCNFPSSSTDSVSKVSTSGAATAVGNMDSICAAVCK